MRINKIALFLLISALSILIIFLLIFRNNILKGINDLNNVISNNSSQQQQKNNIIKKKEIDYIKDFSKIDDSKTKCSKFVDRINSEIEDYKYRIARISSERNENFNLIGIFYSIHLNKCFYVLKDSYDNNGSPITDYIINNAEQEETIDIFNNVDYNFLNERIGELQK